MVEPVGIENLQRCRSVLIRTIEVLPPKQLDFRLLNNTKSVGEILLHIGGFEYLLVAAAVLAEQEPDHELWSAVKPGFGREAGFEPPSGHELEHYLEVLEQVRATTIRHLRTNPDAFLPKPTSFPLGTLLDHLRGADADIQDAEAYKKLASGVGTSFADDGVINKAGRADILATVLLHETYHRGQITFQKYLYANRRAQG